MVDNGEERGPVTVTTVQGDFDAIQVVAFLEAHGVAASVRGEALRRTHGLTLNGLGQVEVQVAPSQVLEATTLLAAVERGELSLESEDSAD